MMSSFLLVALAGPAGFTLAIGAIDAVLDLGNEDWRLGKRRAADGLSAAAAQGFDFAVGFGV